MPHRFAPANPQSCAETHAADIHGRRWLEQEDYANLNQATLDAMTASLAEAAFCYAEFFPEGGIVIELTQP